MIVKVLGSAAGGAFPQWNCACSNCSRLRARELTARPRSQSQLAVSADGVDWHLLNASPDLRLQIEAHPELHPKSLHGTRHSPIRSAIITNADLDHVLGLLLMRESQPLSIQASPSVTRILLEDNSFFGMLRQNESQTRWTPVLPGTRFELMGPAGDRSEIFCTPHTVEGRFPRYVAASRVAQLKADEAVYGLVLEQVGQGRRVGYFPGLAHLTPELERTFSECDVLFVDGTFWDENELKRIHGSAKAASEMGHIPLSGSEGTIARLSSLKNPRKIFIHINNTNPILDEKSDEHRRTIDSGWEIAHDGLEIRL